MSNNKEYNKYFCCVRISKKQVYRFVVYTLYCTCMNNFLNRKLNKMLLTPWRYFMVDNGLFRQLI